MPFFEGLLAGYGIAIPVGAIAVLIIDTAIRCGFCTGFMAGAGAATADLVYAGLAGVAGVALSAALAPLADVLGWVGGLVLMLLAAAGLRRAWRQEEREMVVEDDCQPARTYVKFVGLTLINPLTVVYFSALILGQESTSGLWSSSQVAVFVAAAGLASFSWQSLLAALGGVAGARLSPRIRTYTSIAGNLIVLGLGLRMLLAAL
ncbi:MAG: LysE family transporter [Anaerolineales bacterium]|jgi:threonine/homoserine/homoserine lactone efflux protein